MQRIVKPEILDSLPIDHPEAIRTRKDIQKFNFLLGNFRFIRKELLRVYRSDMKLLEIGAGSGELGQYLRTRCLPEKCEYTGLDLWPRPTSWPDGWQWVQADALDYTGYAKYDIVIANLLLHQFQNDELNRLGKLLQKSHGIWIFCELSRRPLHLYQLPFANLLGMSKVSRHDARASIEAGFVDNELPELLGINRDTHHIDIQTGFLGQYRLVACPLS